MSYVDSFERVDTFFPFFCSFSFFLSYFCSFFLSFPLTLFLSHLTDVRLRLFRMEEKGKKKVFFSLHFRCAAWDVCEKERKKKGCFFTFLDGIPRGRRRSELESLLPSFRHRRPHSYSPRSVAGNSISSFTCFHLISFFLSLSWEKLGTDGRMDGSLGREHLSLA